MTASTLKRKNLLGLCLNPMCRNRRGKKRLKCWKCIKSEFRSKYPLHNAFFNLRQNAKRRGKEFTLTIDQFRKFVDETDYLKKRGIKSMCLSIDRIDNLKGYIFENIRAITVSANSYKRNFIDYF